MRLCTCINGILLIYKMFRTVVGTSSLFSDEMNFTYTHEIICVLDLFKI